MGIDNLAAILKKCVGPKADVSVIATLYPSGTVVGLDVSCKLVPWAKSIRGAEEYHSDPRTPATHVASQCLNYVRRLQRKNLHVIPVFDGLSRHRLKAKVAGKKRDTTIESALSMLTVIQLIGPWIFADFARSR